MMLKVSILGIVVNPWQDNLNVTKRVLCRNVHSENASIYTIMICAYMYAYQFVHIYIYMQSIYVLHHRKLETAA